MDDFDALVAKYSKPEIPKEPRMVSPYDGFIEESASKHGVDPDLIRLQMGTESAFKPKARSPKGASGLMQLMPATAKNLGVKNIYDPKENIEGGVKYMRQLLDMFGGDVNLALAGYNAGEGAVQKYGNKIPPYKETQNYVKKITGNYKGKGYRQQASFDDLVAKYDVKSDFDSLVAKYQPEDTGTIYGMTGADIKGGATTSPTFDTPQTVPESPDAIQSQIISTFDVNSPKSMTLLPQGNPANNYFLNTSEAKRLTRVDTPNGIVLVNAKKLNIKPSEAKEYVKKNGFAKDSGFVIDMGNNTGDGQPAVAAVDPNTGKEVFAAVTPTPESAQLQAQQNAAMFPGTVQVPTNTDEVAAKRLDEGVAPRADKPRTQADINAEFERWIVANRLPRDNESIAKFNAMKQAEVDDENAKIRAENNAINVGNNVNDLVTIGEAAKDGKRASDVFARQAEIQARFDAEKAKNPALTTDEFNKTLQAEAEQKFLAENATYADFLKQTGLPNTKESIDEFNTAQKASVEGANKQNRIDAVKQPATTRVTASTKTPQEQTSQQATQPASKGYDFEISLADKPASQSYKEWVEGKTASGLASKLGVDYDTVKRALRQFQGARIGDSANQADEEYYAALAKQGDSNRVQIGSDIVAAIKKQATADVENNAKLDASRAKLSERNPDLEVSPEMFEIMAAQDAGLIGQSKGDALLLKAKDDYIGWLIAKGYAEESAIKKAFGIKDDKPLDAATWALYKNPIANLLGFGKPNTSKVKDDIRKSILDDIQTYGSLASATKAAKKQAEEKAFSKGIGQPSEFVKKFPQYLAKLASTAMEVGAIAADANPIDIGYELLTGKETGVKTGLMKAAKDWRDYVDKDPVLGTNPAYSKDTVVKFGDVAAQLATQMISAPFTGGASLALPLAEGATAQFREADEAGANRPIRLLAATIGAGLAAPDVLLHAKYLKSLELPFIDKLTRGLFSKLSKSLGEKEARELTQVTVGSFIKSLGKNATVNSPIEGQQERWEDVGNKLLKKLAYKPDTTWEDVFVPTSEEQEMYALAAVAGVGGAGVETTVEAMSDAELQKGDTELSKLLANGRISEGDYKRAEQARKKEIATRIKRGIYFAKDAEIQQAAKPVEAKPVTETPKKVTLEPVEDIAKSDKVDVSKKDEKLPTLAEPVNEIGQRYPIANQDAPQISKDETFNENLLVYLDEPNTPQMQERFGKEKVGKTFENGIERLDGQYGSWRYVFRNDKGESVGVIQGVQVDGENVISNAFVRPDYRRKGVSSKLLNVLDKDKDNIVISPGLSKSGAALMGVTSPKPQPTKPIATSPVRERAKAKAAEKFGVKGEAVETKDATDDVIERFAENPFGHSVPSGSVIKQKNKDYLVIGSPDSSGFNAIPLQSDVAQALAPMLERNATEKEIRAALPALDKDIESASKYFRRDKVELVSRRKLPEPTKEQIAAREATEKVDSEKRQAEKSALYEKAKEKALFKPGDQVYDLQGKLQTIKDIPFQADGKAVYRFEDGGNLHENNILSDKRNKAQPKAEAVKEPQSADQLTNLDIILDKVSADSEVTLSIKGEISREQVRRVEAEATKRGMSAAFDGHGFLIRKLASETQAKEPWEMTQEQWNALPSSERTRLHGDYDGGRGANPSHSNYHSIRVLSALKNGENVPREVLDELDKSTRGYDAGKLLEKVAQGETFPQGSVDWAKDNVSPTEQARIIKNAKLTALRTERATNLEAAKAKVAKRVADRKEVVEAIKYAKRPQTTQEIIADDANTSDEANVVRRAVGSSVTNLGQLSKAEVRALNKAVKDGVLIKAKNASFPTPKTMWMAPAPLARASSSTVLERPNRKGSQFFTFDNAVKYIEGEVGKSRKDVEAVLQAEFGLDEKGIRKAFDSVFPTQLKKMAAYRRAVLADEDFQETGEPSKEVSWYGENIGLNDEVVERINERLQASHFAPTDFDADRKEGQAKTKLRKSLEARGQGRFTDDEGRALLSIPETDPLQGIRVDRLPKPLSGDAKFLEHRADATKGDAELLLRLTHTKTFRDKGLGGFDVPSQRAVMASVIRTAQNLKIRDAIVQFVPVDVMDYLIGFKPSLKVSLHDEAVFPKTFAINHNNSISMSVDVADAMVIAATNAGAERVSRGANAERIAGELNPTDKTSTINSGHNTDLQKQSIVSKGGSEVESDSPTSSILSQIYNKENGYDAAQLKDVTERIRSGSLEINRLDRQAERGRIKGGRRNVEASVILAGSERAIQKASSADRTRMDSHSDTVKRQERVLENYAKRNDIWFKPGHFPERLYLGKGGEAVVYSKDEKRVVKIIDYRHIDRSMIPLNFLDNRISLFNHLFPESPYELMGFMRDEAGKFRFVVTQPLIQGEKIKTQADVDAAAKAAGLKRTERESYANDLYEVHDLHVGNVLKDKGGNIFVIDAVPKAKQVQPFTVVRPDEALRSVADIPQSQIDAVKEVRNADGKLLAPNGKVSNLNERQWKEVRTPNFINFFGDWRNDPKNASQIVDENGEPMQLIHTTKEEFTTFDKSKIGARWTYYGDGFYFAISGANPVEFGNIQVKAFVNVRNPYYAELSEKGDQKADTKALKSKGYDGIIVDAMAKDGQYRGIGSEYVIFEPNQIKSSTSNNGNFDPSDPSILRSIADTQAEQQKRNWSNSVKAFFDGKRWKSPVQIFDHTPTILKKLGVPSKSLYVTPDVVDKLRDDHGLNVNQVTAIFDELIDPLMVFDSATQAGSKVVVTTQTNYKGEPIIVSIKPNGEVTVKTTKQGDTTQKANIVTSAYGKPKTTLQHRIDDGLLLYRNTEKGKMWWHGQNRLHLPTRDSRDSTSKSKILTQADFVNSPLFKVAEPTDIADIEALGKGDFKELFNDIKSDVKSDENGANILDLGTNKTIELVRTAFAYMYDTPLEGTAIPGGMYLDPSQTNDFRDALQGIADAASEAGIESKGVDTLIKNLDKAAKDGDVRVIGFDNTLPHETIHQQSRRGAIDKELSQRYSDDGLGDDPVFNKFHKKLVEIQGKASLAVAREEALAYLSSGDYARFGLTEAQATEIVAKLIESYAAKNGLQSLKTFDGTQAYEAVENYYRKIESRETSNDSRSGVSGERETRPGATESERAENDTGERGETFTPGGREKLSKTPSTLRKGGIPVQERLYTSTTDAERQSFANERMDDGLDAAMKWTRDQLDTKNNNAGATGVVGVNVMVQLGKEGRIAELNKFADDLLPAYTDSAQMIQSLAVVSMFSPDTAGAYVTKVAKQNGQDVTPEQVEKALEIAKRMSEVVQADGITEQALNEAKAESERLTKDIADLTEALGLANDKNKQFKGKLTGQGRTIAALRRQIEGETKSTTRLPGAVKKHVKEIVERKDDILERLKQKYGGNPILRMVAWHGSPHTFDKFDISKIGTGEGAQAYGHGLYFTDKEAVADYYKGELAKKQPSSIVFPDGQILKTWDDLKQFQPSDVENTAARALMFRGDFDQAVEKLFDDARIVLPEDSWVYRDAANQVIQWQKDGVTLGGKQGAKYRVDLKPEADEYLLWDKPLSEQSEKVRAALKPDPTIRREYDAIVRKADRLDKEDQRDTPEWDEMMDGAKWRRQQHPTLNIHSGLSGDDVYHEISQILGDKEASDYLKSLGIRGIKYLDGTSRGKGEGSYNYVIFDDADVEIQEVLRQVAEKPAELDQDAVDAATIHLSKNLGKQTPAQVKDAINVLTNGQLTKQQIDDVYAAAVSALRIERTAMDADTKAANKLRQGHYREADKINDAKLTEWEKKLSKPDTKFVNTTVREGVENGYTDEAIWFALARKHHPNVNDALKALREEFPDVDRTNIIRDSERLTQAVKARIAADIAQRQNQFTLNDEDIALIKEERRVNTHEKQKVVREANRFYSGMVKDAGEIILDTIVNFRRANLLTAVKTHFVNIGGNVGFAIGEEIARAPSTVVDLAASIFTGERTTTLSAKAIGNGLKALVSQDETLKNSKWDTPEGKERGITAAKHVLQYGGPIADMERLQHSESILSAKFENRAARWVDNYINGVFKTLGAEDAFFKVYAFRRHIEEQARAIAITERRQDKSINLKERIKELVANPTNVMQVQADRYAHFMTFQNDNALSGFIASIKRGRPGLKAGVETIMPYDRTPTNIVMRVMEYTPAGMAIAPIRWKGAQRSFDRNKPSGLKFRNELTGAVKADLAQNEDFNNLPETERRKIVEATLQKVFTREQQETFAKTIGRSSLGTGLFSLGFVLAAAGLMAGAMSFDDDDKTESTEAEKRKKAGIENGSIQTPWGRIVLPKSPPTMAMLAGATFYEQMAISKKSPLLAAVDAGVEVFSDMAKELPQINSTYSVMRSLGKGKFGEFTGNIASGFVPASAMLRSLSDLTDDKERTGSGYKKDEKIKSPEQWINYQGRGLRNSFVKGLPWFRQYADESTSGVSDIERGGIGRRIVRIIDPFNTRTEAPPQPGTVKEMIDGVVTYAKAIGTDPITAFKIIYKGERIRRVDNNTIIVERMDLEDSKKVKKDRNAQKDERLDHAMPLQLGGLNDDGNLELRPENEWARFTPIENALGRALRAEKITKEEAQKLMRDYKNGDITETDITSFKNGVVTIKSEDAKKQTDLDPKPKENHSAVQKLKELGSVDNLLSNNSVRYWSTDDWVEVMRTDMSDADRQKAATALRKKADNAQKAKSLTPEELERVREVIPDYAPATKKRKFVAGDDSIIPAYNSLYTPQFKRTTPLMNGRQSENVIDQRGGSPLDNFNRAIMEDDINAVAPAIDAFKKSRPTSAEKAEAKKVIRDQINETRYVLRSRTGDRKASINVLRTLMQYQRQLN